MVETQTRAPRVGEPAPDFSLIDTSWKHLTLSACRGQTTVLLFFPAAFSGTCTTELYTFRQSLSALHEHGAHVVGISVDLPYTLKQFKQLEKLTFTLLSDFDRRVIAQYGVVDVDFNGFTSGVAQRSVFVVDPEGIVAFAWVSEDQGEEPEYAGVLAVVEEIDARPK
jgi:peroxiredoxin